MSFGSSHGKQISGSKFQTRGRRRWAVGYHPAAVDELECRRLLSLDGNQLFPSDNPWNHPITDAPVAANSATLVASIGANDPLHPDFGTTYNGLLNGIPYNTVTSSQPKVNVTIDAYPSESDLDPVPIPAGAVIEGDAPGGQADYQQLPSYAQASLSGQYQYTWSTSTTDAQAIEDPLNPSNRVASTWYSSTQFDLNLDITDGNAHRIALYLLDDDAQGRSENVSVVNPTNGQVLASQAVSGFSGGTYLIFDVTGDVQLQFTCTGGPNAVLSGLFFGASGSPSIPASSQPAAAFVGTDTTTQGSWQGVYGADGYFLPTVNGEGDRHLIVYDETDNILYELFNAHRPSEEPDGQWHADSEAVWNLNVDDFRTPGYTSADAAGLPILPGLVRPDEVLQQGAIDHALRFTVPETDAAYVFPASHEAGVDNPDLPPMGERFRLNPDFDISSFPPADQVILQALKTYGMIVADNGSPWFISGTPSSEWDDDTLHDLTEVIGSDFQAVDLTPVVSSLVQTSGASGTAVTVQGINFTGVAGQLSVSFGGIAATSVTVENDNTLIAIAPPQAAGTVDVTVTTPYGTSTTSSADQFTYVANSIADAGFETPFVGTGSFNDFATDPGGTAWTFAGAAGVTGNGSGYTSANPNAPEGTQVAFLQMANSSISQEVSLSAGTYNLSFSAAQRMWDQAAQNFEVLLDGNVIGTFTPSSTSYYQYATSAFTVTAGVHTIEFLSLDTPGGDNTALIDNVQINAVAVGQFADAGFESPAVGTGSFDDFATDPSGTGWTFAGPAGVTGNGSGYTSANPNAPEGTQVALLQMANASISQQVSLAAGTYSLSFSAAQRMWDQANQNFQVLLDGNVIGTFTPSSTSYNQYSTNAFTVSAGVHTFEFLSLNTAGGDNTAFIDNVQIVTVPIGQFADAGFETPSVGTGSFYDFALDPSGAGWTFAGPAGVAGNGSGYTSANPNAPQGTQVGYLQMANASISQEVSLSAGTYNLSFYAAQRMWDQANQNFQVLMDGTVIGTFSPSGTNYYQYSTNAFTVSAGAHTFEFLSLDTAGGDNTALIDNVQINSVAVGQFADSGFETPSVGTGSFNDFATDPSGTGWIFAGAAGVAGNGSGYTSANPNAPQGTQVGLLQMANSSISQQVSLASGTYQISFQAAQRMWDQANQDFELLVDGVVVSTFIPSGTSYQTYTSNPFTLSAGVHTFEFLSLDTAGGDNTALIDNVQIVSG